MNEASITKYILETFADVETEFNYGYTFFFHRSDHKLPFTTIASSDNEYEQISQLNRPGVYRLNIGVSRETFQALFGTDKVDVSAYDFTALDLIMPHPDYAKQHFICVLSPSEETFEKVRPMLAEAYAIAVKRFKRENRK
jgi:hypothetical protein